MADLQLHKYQEAMCSFALNRFAQGHDGAGLFADPGLGKTLVTLETIIRLGTPKTLIVAPLRVCHSVWPIEISKWGFPLSHTVIHGLPKKRRRLLKENTDLHIINPEGLVWLREQPNLPDYDLLVVDESSKFKSWSAKRTIALRKLVPNIPKRLILTGTPASNSLCDIYPQTWIADQGQALGANVTQFRARWCRRCGFEMRSFEVVPALIDKLQAAIAPLCLRMAAEDHLDMPMRVENENYVDLPAGAMKVYRDLERKLFARIDQDNAIVAANSGVAFAKAKQAAGGSIYDEAGEVHQLHTLKLDALEELTGELGGKNLLVAYQYKHDLDALMHRFPKAGCIDGNTGVKKSEELISAFASGELRILAAQCQALAHGIDRLQTRCSDIAWYGLPTSLEIFDQFNGRIYRQGQSERQVRLHFLMARGTIDEAILKRLRSKDRTQQALFDAITAYRNGKGTQAA